MKANKSEQSALYGEALPEQEPGSYPPQRNEPLQPQLPGVHPPQENDPFRALDEAGGRVVGPPAPGDAPTTVQLGALAGMNEGEREAVYRALLSEARNPSVATLNAVEAQIRAFELRYERSSGEMRQALKEGKLRETAEIAQWLFLLGMLDAGVSA